MPIVIVISICLICDLFEVMLYSQTVRYPVPILFILPATPTSKHARTIHANLYRSLWIKAGKHMHAPVAVFFIAVVVSFVFVVFIALQFLTNDC